MFGLDYWKTSDSVEQPGILFSASTISYAMNHVRFNKWRSWRTFLLKWSGLCGLSGGKYWMCRGNQSRAVQSTVYLNDEIKPTRGQKKKSTTYSKTQRRFGHAAGLLNWFFSSDMLKLSKNNLHKRLNVLISDRNPGEGLGLSAGQSPKAYIQQLKKRMLEKKTMPLNDLKLIEELLKQIKFAFPNGDSSKLKEFGNDRA